MCKRVFLVLAAFCLLALPALPQQAPEQPPKLPATQQPTATQKAPASQRPPFGFTKVDLELLEKCNQLDRYFQDKGMVFDDKETTGYVTAVGEAVLPPGPPPENIVWRFRVLRDPTPNAFALANGSIYVHTGLLALLENEAQLAGVLAHEETHVLEHHSYLENRSYRKKMVAAHIFAAAGSVAGAVGGVAANTVSIIANMVPSILVATVYGYSRELERDADVRAVSAMVEADYSAEEMINSFRLLQQSHEVELTEAFYTDHPKLTERIAYVTELVNLYRSKTRHPMVEAERYAAAVEKPARHNIGLDIQEGRARTAAFVAQRLATLNPKSSENFYALGEAFRALGPRTPEPTPDELSSKGKKETRKRVQKMTLQEYETALIATPQGKAAWEVNRKKGEEAYRKALELDAANAKAHRGLGFLFERDHQVAPAVEEFRKYLELSPAAPDRLQISRHIEQLEKQGPQQAPAPPQPERNPNLHSQQDEGRQS